MNKLDKEGFILRLSESFKKKGINPKKHGFFRDLSLKYEVSKQTPNDWFALDKGYPKLESLVMLANDLDVSVDYLLFGTRSDEAIMVPVLSPKSVVSRVHCKESVPVDDWIPAMFSLKNGFAIVLQDDSMLSAVGRSFFQGEIIVFDEQRKSPKNGDLVFAIVNNDNGIFAKYINQIGKEYLSLLNNRYENIVEPFEVIGIFSYSIRRLTYSRHQT